MGFTGLSELVTYIQLAMAILPLFVLVTTVRSVAGDREAGVFEYLLSLPIGLAAWYWGKLAGRFLVVFVPVLLALALALGWGMVRGAEIPWGLFAYYTALLMVLAWCFLGIGMLVSTWPVPPTWPRAPPSWSGSGCCCFWTLSCWASWCANPCRRKPPWPSPWPIPLQVFRTASMMLFDPQLVLLGPTAYLILDHFGQVGYMTYALVYPWTLGTLFASLGYLWFKRGDLP